jgi:hypothetical protein
MLAKVVACVGSSAGIFLAYTLVLVVRTQPWWQARPRSSPVLRSPGAAQPRCCCQQWSRSGRRPLPL